MQGVYFGFVVIIVMSDRVLLNIKRFIQMPGECAIAAASSIANYYDPLVNYKEARNLVSANQRKNGLWTSQQARLLNKLGFTNVAIVTAEQEMVDFSWSKLSKHRQIKKLHEKSIHYKRRGDKFLSKWVVDMEEWLSDEECDNQLIIDWDFAKHIRRGLSANRPVGVSIAWTTFFRLGKYDDIKGDDEDHAVVLRGYDQKGVFVVDSHNYSSKFKKYKNGYYKVPWEKFLVNIPSGDLVIVW